MSKDCLFCKIVSRAIPANIVYETGDLLAFNDVKPQAPVHILIIPKKHIDGLCSMKKGDSVIIAKLIEAANNIARDKGINKSGYRTVFNSGKDAGQAVGHLHMHLLGGRAMSWPPG